MVFSLLSQLFGNENERQVKSYQKHVQAINALESKYADMDDETLKGQTDIFRKRLADGEILDDIIIEAFAVTREASKRTLGMRHFDVQLIGGMVLNDGKITEMKTGEGKTLVATLAVYLNAIEGKGVHVVTVNDYLAKRDAEWMGEIYRFLGLTVGCITGGMDDEERKAAYAADVTYGTNNEFGFDYLRDNMKFRLSDMVQREFNFAIVDEVDSILIDEARTPLIISGPAEDSSELYTRVNELIPRLKSEHYEKDEKSKSITLTETGISEIEGMLKSSGLLTQGSMYDPQNIALVHHVNQALRAHHMFQRDVDYIVKDDKVIIIDEFTGRMMEGRRFSEGLHQALEAKEHASIQLENQTLASITFQNYFRMYDKLAGMTGTALTEATEFAEIYGLEVLSIPTNVPVAREDNDDEIYMTAQEKYSAIVSVIRECNKRNQPVLVGTVSIEKSEFIAAILKKEKIAHNVLNARHHDKEALIIAQAGAPGAVTIATNMAGRGTDIQLGGNLDMRLERELKDMPDGPKRDDKEAKIRAEVEQAKDIVIKAGGLYVVGTERHESRRIDNQLRGRSGRQGDPGASLFFMSLEDDLMRIFGSDRMDSILRKLGLEEGEAIVHPWINKAIERAQKRVEGHNFEIRKHLLKYDDVMNDQRREIYDQRRYIMDADDVSDTIIEMREAVIDSLIARATDNNTNSEKWDLNTLHEECLRIFGLDLDVEKWVNTDGIGYAVLEERIQEAVTTAYAEKVVTYTPELMRLAEKNILLQLLDQLWKDHLLSLDHLRQGINLRAYAQRDPLNEYKREAFELFSDLVDRLNESVIEILSHIRITSDDIDDAPQQRSNGRLVESRNDPAMIGGGESESEPVGPIATIRHPGEEEFEATRPETWGKVGRNAPCPCGSGKKFKQCHGANA